MDVVWRSTDPVTIRHIVDRLAPEHEIAYTTAITVVERLRSKGWLNRERQGRSFLYSAPRDESEYTAWLMSQALEGASDRSAALLNFTGSLSAAEVEALRAALARPGSQD